MPESIAAFVEDVLCLEVVGFAASEVRETFSDVRTKYLNEQHKAFSKTVVTNFLAKGLYKTDAEYEAREFLYNDALAFLDSHKVINIKLA